jgi:hypothetical protein
MISNKYAEQSIAIIIKKSEINRPTLGCSIVTRMRMLLKLRASITSSLNSLLSNGV